MITCINTNRITDLAFSDYLLLPQYSHSYLKNEKHGFSTFKAATPKMQLGSLVDAIITNGNVDMGHKLYPAARNVANVLKNEFGYFLDKLSKQVSYTGTMQYNTSKAIFGLPVKGRPDLEWPKEFIVDLKITNEPRSKIDSLIDFMGYKNQQFGYAKMANCKKAFLLMYSVPSNQVVLKRIVIGEINHWWQEKIIKFGKVIQQ